MTATTTDRNTPRRAGEDYSFGVAASTKIPAGVIVQCDSTGYARNGTADTSVSLKTLGVSQALADNSAGAAGATLVPVKRGVFRFGNSASSDAIALKDINADCYVVDNQTVALTNGSSTRVKAGVIKDVDADGVWVDF